MTKRWLVSFFLVSGFGLAPAASPGAEPPMGSASLVLRVVSPDGRPIPGAAVHAGMQLEEIDGPEGQTWQETTAADGTVRLAGLPMDEVVWLLVERKGFFPELRNMKPGTGERREMRVGLRPGGVAVGRVVDEAGRPVAGAEVEIEGSPFDLWTDLFPAFLRDQATRRVRTGPAGRFRFRDLPEGEYELRIQHPSYVPLVADHPVRGGRSGDLGRFVLRRGEALRGLATDPEGRPIAGLPLWAVTELTEEEGAPPPSATTGPDGTFVIPHLPPGTLDLYACGPGYLQQMIAVRFLDEPVHLTLEPAAMLRGQVLDPEGRPLAGARLTADQSGFVTLSCGALWTPCAPQSSASTDAEGRFEVGPLAPGWYDLHAAADGLQPGVLEMLRAPAGKPVEGIEIRLQPGEKNDDSSPGKSRELLPVQGRVVGPDGAPVEQALIAAFGAQTWSLPDGSFELRLPPGEAMEIQVNKPGFALLSATVDPANPPPGGIELRLEHGTTVAGRVLGLAAAEREPRTEIQLADEGDTRLHSALRSDGTFQIDHVAPGTWEVQVLTETRTAHLSLVVEPGQTEVSVEIEMAPTHTVTGAVLDELARPIGGAVIYGSNEDGMVLVWESTRADGSFALQLPDGRFDVAVERKGFHKIGVELHIDGGPVEGLELRLTPSTTLRGSLFALAPGEVPAIEAKGPDNLAGEVGLDRYSITGLGPGTWTIEAILLDFNEPNEKRLRWTIEIPPGATEMDLDLDFAAAEEKP
jgi:protocatechuate 3,4-dioxygenase beta subunit